MNTTTSAGALAKSESETCFPLGSGNRKSGAFVPSGNIVEFTATMPVNLQRAQAVVYPKSAASREPAVVMTGISPSGFGNVAEGEIRIWYDWIHSQQEAHDRIPIGTMLNLVQLSLFGEIDPDITFDFVPLYQMTELELSTMRNNDSIRAGNYIDRGVLDAQEERERLARDPDSGYQGIDVEREIAPPDEAEESANLARGTE